MLTINKFFNKILNLFYKIFSEKTSIILLRNFFLKKSFNNSIPRKLFNTSSVPAKDGKRIYGGLKDQDRIFNNIYCDTDPFIEGAIIRVSSHV